MPIHQGFVLSRRAYDLAQQTRIELWLSTPEGPCQLLIDGQQPVFFLKQRHLKQVHRLIEQHQLSITVKPLALKTFDQAPVLACYAPTIRSSKHAAQIFSRHDITTFETDITLAERYLMERFIKGGLEFTGVKQYPSPTCATFHRVHQPTCRQAFVQPQLTLLVLDTHCLPDSTLLRVGLKTSQAAVLLGQDTVTNTNSTQCFPDERSLLLAIVQWIETADPDIVLGWSIQDHLNVLVTAAKRYGLKLTLGRGQQPVVLSAQRTKKGGRVDLPGRIVLDGIEQLKTATYSFQSWTLSHVSQQLLRDPELKEPSQGDPLTHCRQIYAIIEHTSLVEFCIRRVQLTGLAMERSGGSVAAFVYLYLPQLHRSGYVAPNLDREHWEPSPGGYVMSSVPGLHRSVLVLDFKSLYPSIIRTFLVDPLGLIEGLTLPNATMATSDTSALPVSNETAIPGFMGGQFHRTQHILPGMIEALWKARDEAKAQQQTALSTNIKLIMNSFYGVMGSAGCRFFDKRLAASITCRGHEIILQTRTLIESMGYQVIYGDTDSLFVALNTHTNETQAQLIGGQICDFVNQWWTDHIQQQYALTSYLELEHETHYQRFFLPTLRGEAQGSKKRYAGWVVNGSNAHVVFKGLESVRSDWTPLSQDFQRQLYQLIFTDQDPGDYIRQTIQGLLAGQFDDQLYYRKRIRRPLNTYTKNTPPQIKAARAVDQHRLAQGESPIYALGGSIEYMMTTAGPQAREYVFSPPDYGYYLSRQLQSVAEAILPMIGCHFSSYC